MRVFLAFIAIAGLLISSFPTEAKIYKWVDENGKAHFTDDPARIPEDDESKIETFREIVSPPAKKMENQQGPNSGTSPQGKEGVEGKEASMSPGVVKKKSGPPPGLDKLKKSYEQQLKQSHQTLKEKQKIIDEIQRTGKKPDNWHTKETAEEILERYKLNVKKAEKEIKQHQEKINSLTLKD